MWFCHCYKIMISDLQSVQSERIADRDQGYDMESVVGLDQSLPHRRGSEIYLF